jgi:hypothetical protein
VAILLNPRPIVQQEGYYGPAPRRLLPQVMLPPKDDEAPAA